MRRAIVAGLGLSAEGFKPPDEDCVTWGVNDIGRHFTPTNLVVLDGPDRFHPHHTRPDALEVIMRTRSRYLWFLKGKCAQGPERVVWRGEGTAPVSWGSRWPGSQIIPVEAKNVDKTKPISFDTRVVPLFHTSVFAATWMAIKSRTCAQLIGLIGVDLEDHPHFQPANVMAIDVQFRRLADAAEAYAGTRVVNLSARSCLTRLPKMTLEEFSNELPV